MSTPKQSAAMTPESIAEMRQANTRMARALELIVKQVPTVEHYAESHGMKGWASGLPSAVHISLTHITDAAKAGLGTGPEHPLD